MHSQYFVAKISLPFINDILGASYTILVCILTHILLSPRYINRYSCTTGSTPPPLPAMQFCNSGNHTNLKIGHCSIERSSLVPLYRRKADFGMVWAEFPFSWVENFHFPEWRISIFQSGEFPFSWVENFHFLQKCYTYWLRSNKSFYKGILRQCFSSCYKKVPYPLVFGTHTGGVRC